MRLTPSLGNSSHNTKKTFNNLLLPRSLFFFDSVARPSVAVTRGRAQCRSPIIPLPVSPPWAVKISLFGADAQATPGSLRVRPTPRRHPRQRLHGPTSTAPSQVYFFSFLSPRGYGSLSLAGAYSHGGSLDGRGEPSCRDVATPLDTSWARRVAIRGEFIVASGPAVVDAPRPRSGCATFLSYMMAEMSRSRLGPALSHIPTRFDVPCFIPNSKPSK